MVDINDVIWAFEQGEIEKESGNFLIAARYYRVAMVSYSHCELPARDTLPPTILEKIDKVCDNPYEQFHQMSHKLTPTQRLMLASEKNSRRRKIEPDKDYYEWMWKDLIRYDLAMINLLVMKINSVFRKRYSFCFIYVFGNRVHNLLNSLFC